MTGTTSIRAVPEGVELRNSGNRIIIYRHQVAAFTQYATKWAEQLGQQQEHAGGKNDH